MISFTGVLLILVAPCLINSEEISSDDSIDHMAEWTEWSRWSKCSRECGTGIAYKTRMCNMAAKQSKDGTKHNMKSNCVGMYKQYKICNAEQCDPGKQTFREEQCSKHNNKVYYRRRYQWVPYKDAPKKCELSCQAKGYNFYVRLAASVEDGTLCDPDSTDVCIKGRCQKVGCDGVVGSGVVLDKCGVCGGDDKSCRVVSGIFVRPHLKYGYSKITTVPVGACNINITERRYSRNYLALKTASGKPIINGNWSIDSSGNFYSAGTTFKYRRPHHHRGEHIIGKGPVTEALEIFILYQVRNPGVYYEYTIPIVQRKVPHSPNYVPDASYPQYLGQRRAALDSGTGSTGGRSGSYPVTNQGSRPLYVADRQALTSGGTSDGTNRFYKSNSRRNYLPNYSQQTNTNNNQGIHQYYSNQRKNVNRQRNGGRHHQQSGSSQRAAISPLLPPPTYNQGQSYPLRPTYNQHPRRVDDTQTLSSGADNEVSRSGHLDTGGGFTWKIAGFTECNRECGGGQQLTKIVCVNTHTLVIVTNENCAEDKKPQQQSVTCNTDPCQPDWEATKWSKCTTTCGKGHQTRKVECKQRISATLHLSVSADLCKDKPRLSTYQMCQNQLCYTWKVGEWTECSVECGRGKRTRRVECLDQEGNSGTDEDCRYSHEKPRTEEPCDQGPCKKTWFYTKWSDQCSADCGEGTYTRKVYCDADQGRKYGRTSCSQRDRPEAEKPCDAQTNCGGQWFTGPWSKCKGTCTDGYQTRQVACMKKHGRWYAMVEEASCIAEEKPSERQSCEQIDCDTEWYMSDWSQCSITCGQGYKTRDVKCLDKKQKPSQSCRLLTKPSTKVDCEAAPCPTQPPADPGCKDKHSRCKVVVQARLCKYSYYKRLCCGSCIGH